MSRDISLLKPSFRNDVQTLLANCYSQGYEMRVFFTVRDPWEQARLWRQSRSTNQINAAIEKFEKNDANFLASVIKEVGPQNGRHVTNAMPGYSWHQWGEAVDCYWLLNGDAEWSTSKKVNGKNGYRVYAEQAQLLNLTAGGFWSIRDWVHVQLRSESSPSKLFSMVEIDREMRKLYG